MFDGDQRARRHEGSREQGQTARRAGRHERDALLGRHPASREVLIPGLAERRERHTDRLIPKDLAVSHHVGGQGLEELSRA